ncbi:hypothetical protein ALC56_09300 [Trachymyrmex septentrionalis]|uniref:Uncharacterized protein n=1 Tax=Trachymyrmex septentrionalis TaxID=34720 RepID=A0A195F6W5_9HYME|nr:hypothetical protein ALC56_09300 [Trachymyrmex septentrionalis]
MNISVPLCTSITSRKLTSLTSDIFTLTSHQIASEKSRETERFHRLTLTRDIRNLRVGIKKAANTYSWGTHRPWAARGTGGTFQCDIRRRCAGAWARTDIRRAIWDWESPRPRAADSRCRARSLDAPPASRPDAKTDARLLCWSSMKADLPLWETGVLEVVLSPPLPPGGPGVTEPRPA